MKDDIRKYVPDLATVLKETEPDVIKARREQALEEFNVKPDEPVPYEVPDKAAGTRASEHAAESAPRSRWRSRGVILAGALLALSAPLVLAAVFARREGAGETGPRAAASAAAVVPSASSREEGPAPSAGASASATGPRPTTSATGPRPTASASAKLDVEPRRPPRPTMKTVTAVDAGSAGDQDPGLNE